ncbi:hypothetical protein A9Q95_04730 [Rhodobacterales bacterium 59_46_T64]|nr:hypothetical protein A9Q95_04730 [Rhodobacterales bacterium 59_46_T64]
MSDLSHFSFRTCRAIVPAVPKGVGDAQQDKATTKFPPNGSGSAYAPVDTSRSEANRPPNGPARSRPEDFPTCYRRHTLFQAEYRHADPRGTRAGADESTLLWTAKLLGRPEPVLPVRRRDAEPADRRRAPREDPEFYYTYRRAHIGTTHRRAAATPIMYSRWH